MSGPEERVEVPGVAGESLLTPGGKVDAEAVRRAIDHARAAAADEETLPQVTFTLARDLKTRLDKYLTSRITFLSRTQLQRLIESGGVEVNGAEAKSSTKLRQGDVVSVVIPPPPSKEILPEQIPLDVLFEDEHLLVLNKQPDIIVHPARSHLKGTLINALAWHFQHTSSSGGALSTVGEEFARPGVVHRLDRHTTGCIVFAKNEEAHWKLGRQFEHRTVQKRYLALVHGRVEPADDVIDRPIGPHPSREKGYREKYVVRHDDQGKNAVTLYHVTERFRHHDRAVGDQDFTLLELDLKTGRTHQIRVHLSHLGWSIVGDDTYAGRALTDASGNTLIDRQALHAATLAFRHPISGDPMSFDAPLPDDLNRAITWLRDASDR